MFPSLYKSFLNSILTIGGAETTVNVNSLLTLDNETITFAYLSPFTKGYIVIDPEAQQGTQPEIISFTGITLNSDSTGTFTGCTRGLSSVTTGSVTANKTYHGTGSPVIISWGAQNISDLITYLNLINNGTYSTATTTTAGIVKTTTNTASGVVVSTDDTRVPTATQTSYLSSVASVLGIYYAADSVGTDSYAITLSPAPGSYTTGMSLHFKAGTANTGAATLAVNALGAKTIKKNFNSDLVTGDILSGQIVEVVYDGTNFQLISPVSTAPLSLVGGGSTTHDISSTTSTVIAHGLGVTPKIARLTGMTAANSSAAMSVTAAVVTGGGASAIFAAADGGTNTTGNAGQASFQFYTSVGSGNHLDGGVTMDATNITIAWSKAGTPTGTIYILWEAIG